MADQAEHLVLELLVLAYLRIVRWNLGRRPVGFFVRGD
ncbi:MAG: hypothetical protein H6Q85_942 [candidate division NC10 bacterium]|nr:hypothetical protein [candidate division NC10 bacterium]